MDDVIRRACAGDVADMVRMNADFVAQIDYPAPIDLDVARDDFCAALVNPNGLALVLERDGRVVGMLLAQAVRLLLTRAMVAQELVFWVDPEARGAGGALLSAYEDWARRMGCVSCSLVTIDERVGVLYRRRGYRRAETVFQKGLSD